MAVRLAVNLCSLCADVTETPETAHRYLAGC